MTLAFRLLVGAVAEAQPAPEGDCEVGEAEPIAHARQHHDASHRFGDFLFTWRPAKGGHKPAWQVTCPYHREGSTKCTRTRTLPNSDSNADADSAALLLSLRAWCLAAEECTTKREHMQLQPQEPFESSELQHIAVQALPPPPSH